MTKLAEILRFKVHPLADLIPAMTDVEYRELVEDIRANGLQEAITLCDGQVLDGRNRARACAELGIESETREYEGDDPAKYVISLNVHRRHLTTTQRAEIALAVLPYYKERAKERMREGGARGGRAEGVGQMTQGLDNRARDAAAADVGVSGITVARLERVSREAPDLHEKVRAGKKSVGQAWEETRQRQAPTRNGAVEVKTKRQREVAEAAKRRIEKLVGTCQAMPRGLPDLKVALAVQVSTQEEVRGWDEVLSAAQSAIKQLRQRLKEAA